jgi:hypothetical protein
LATARRRSQVLDLRHAPDALPSHPEDEAQMKGLAWFDLSTG